MLLIYNIYDMKYLKTFEGIFDMFSKQEGSARKIYTAIKNNEITEVVKKENSGTIAKFNSIEFKFKDVDYSISKMLVYNETKYVLKMGNMKLDCSQKIAESIFNILWYRK